MTDYGVSGKRRASGHHRSLSVPTLRRNIPFQLLWIGGVVDELGSELTQLAMPLLILAVTNSPGWAGIIAGTYTAAHVLAQLPAGVWVDRWDRRLTLLASYGIRSVASAVLAGLIVVGEVKMAYFMVFAGIDGICTAFVRPAWTTAIRGVVPQAQLPSAYAQEEAGRHATGLVGAPLGGLLYQLGRVIPFIIDAASFAVATLCVYLARVPRRPPHHDPDTAAGREQAKRGIRHEAWEAAAWLYHQRGLRMTFLVAFVVNLLGIAFFIPLIVLVRDRGANSVAIGTVLAGAGIGGLVGALLSRKISALLPPGRLLLAIVAFTGVAFATMPLPFGPWWPMIPLILLSLLPPAANVVISVAVTRLVPENMLGRVQAALILTAMGLTPLGPIMGGALASWLGGSGSILLLAGLALLTAALFCTSHELRTFTCTDPEIDHSDNPPTDDKDQQDTNRPL